MEVLRDTTLEVAFVTTPLTPPRQTLTVVVKATFDLPPEGPCVLSAEQLPVAGDVFVDDDPAKALRYESDLAPLKPDGECLILTGPTPPGAAAAFALGPLRRMLAQADGRGLVPSGPVPRTAPARTRLAGTFDAAWQRDRWPFLPVDHDIAYHLAAPPEQRIKGFWVGDEELVLRDLCPGRSLVRTRLPGITPRVFAMRTATGEAEGLRMRLDTIIVDAPAARVIALWRGTFDVADDRLQDLHTLVLWHEPLAARSGSAQARARVEAAHAKAEAELAGFVPEPVPDDDDDDVPLGGTVLFSDAWGPRDEVELAASKALDDARAQIHETLAAMGGAAADDASGGDAADAPTEAQLREAAAATGIPLEALRGDVAPPPDAPPAPAISAARERLFAALEAGAPTSDLDLTGIDLRGVALPGVDLSGCLLTDADLTDAVLPYAKLPRATLTRAKLTGADLTGADLTGADLTGAGGARVSLRGATLRDAVLQGASLPGATMQGCRAERAEARDATLTDADLSDATLDGADLSGARLDGARAPGASLVATSLEGASARGIDLTRADLTKLRASEGAVLAGAMMREVKGAQGIYGDADLSDADLSFGVFRRAEFSRANLAGALLDGCDLKGARAVGAKLAGAMMRRADAMEINLEGADLANADLRGTSLFGAQLWKARVHGARFEQTLLGGTLLERLAETLGAR
ncbi:MAG: pentapeptide repeat-containing protein [Polyangiales bacterium]